MTTTVPTAPPFLFNIGDTVALTLCPGTTGKVLSRKLLPSDNKNSYYIAWSENEAGDTPDDGSWVEWRLQLIAPAFAFSVMDRIANSHRSMPSVFGTVISRVIDADNGRGRYYIAWHMHGFATRHTLEDASTTDARYVKIGIGG